MLMLRGTHPDLRA